MVIGMIVLALIVASYRAMQRSRTTQQVVIEMQQNARTAMTLMRREIRMTNYAPVPLLLGSVVGLTSARADFITFSFDLDADGKDESEGERISYRLNAGIGMLERQGKQGEAFETLAFDIEGLGFAYAVDTDNDGVPDTYGGGVSDHIIWLCSSGDKGTDRRDRHLDTNRDGLITTSDVAGGRDVVDDGWLPDYPALDRVCAVQIWLLARTRSPVPEDPESATYVVGTGAFPLPALSADLGKRLNCSPIYLIVLRN